MCQTCDEFKSEIVEAELADDETGRQRALNDYLDHLRDDHYMPDPRETEKATA